VDLSSVFTSSKENGEVFIKPLIKLNDVTSHIELNMDAKGKYYFD
jgi:hypothetical protein